VRIAIAALLVLLLTGCARTHANRAGRPGRAALFGENFDAGYLSELDPLTLQETGPKLHGFDRIAAGGAAASPDGSRFLLGAGFMGDGSYAIASLHSLRWIDKSVHVARGPNGEAYLGAFAWLRPNRVFTLVEGTGPVAGGPVPWTVAAIVDPISRRVVARRRLPGFTLAQGQIGSQELILLAPFGRNGWHRLAQIGPRGHLRLTPVRLPRTGFGDEGSNAVGFAIDRTHERLFLLPGNGPIAIVDLRTLRVHYRPWPSLKRAFAPAYRVPPENNYGHSVGPFRWASSLGHGVIAVAGWDAHTLRNGSGETQVRPYGLELLDTRRWTAKLVEPRADNFLRAGNVVLAQRSDLVEQQASSPGLGLTGFSPSGRLLFQRYAGTHVYTFVSGDEIYVKRRLRVDVVEVPSGRLVRRIPFRGQSRHQLFPTITAPTFGQTAAG
jgi:hypothetical protein